MTVFPGQQQPYGGPVAREPLLRDTGRGPAHWWGCIQGSEPHDGVCCARGQRLRGGEGAPPAHGSLSSPLEKGRLGHSPRDGRGWSCRTWRPLASCKSRWPGRRRRQQLVPPSFRLPRRRGVRGGREEWKVAEAQPACSTSSRPPSLSALQEASPQILLPGALPRPESPVCQSLLV